MMHTPLPPSNVVPEWARRAIFYHIYPLGFLDAPRSNDLHSEPVPRLAELRRWYDHIQGTGATAIYFGPLFESGSHGYDTVDYFSIDRRLGDITLFKQIVDELHGRGLRVILDGVFNHTGRDFFAFRDLREHGRNSQYGAWYHVNWGGDSRYHDGFSYDSWEDHQALPRLNLANPDVRKYVFEVARMWLADIGVDGWRLDVAYEIGPDFWWEFRRACKEANPDSFLVGEVVNGDYRKWVAPDLLDAGTNYQLYTSMWRSFNDVNLWELKAVIERAVHAEWGLYKDIGLFNFLGNHDVTRILSQFKDPRHIYPALIILMTIPGIPCLYYGDEIAIQGRKEDGDAALRAPMPAPDAEWPPGGRDLYRETGRLAEIRKTNPALIYGRFASLETSDTVFSYLRQLPAQTVVVAINSRDKPVPLTLPIGREGIPDGIAFRDALNPGDPATYHVSNGRLHLDELYADWGRILVSL